MKVYRFNIFFMLLIFAFFSCSKKETKKDDSDVRFRYFNLEKIGWKSKNYTQKVDKIIYTATDVPIQYYLLKDQGDVDLIKVDSVYENNKTEKVIEFVFENENEDDLLKEKYTNLEYKNSLEYMSFKIQNDFFIVTSKMDTVECSGAVFERDFKVSSHNKIILFFSGIDPNEKIQLIYNDKLFGKGILKFKFKEPILNL